MLIDQSKFTDETDKIRLDFGWNDCLNYIELKHLSEFDFKECLSFLDRSANECLHVIRENTLFKLVKFDDELALLKISSRDKQKITIEFPVHNPCTETRLSIAKYVAELFDLKRDLTDFYQLAPKDELLQKLVSTYYGLRIIGIPDLFEALSWAIIGQQINLTFAYTLKKRFVEKFGEKFIHENTPYWLYPAPQLVANLDITDLTELQFTTRKAEYVLGIAKMITDGTLSKEKLLECKNYHEMRKCLLNIRGVGKWTADYVLMKCLRDSSAFPIADVGLHNALKNQLNMDRKPTLDEIENMALKWRGWEGYVTFYLWRSLYG